MKSMSPYESDDIEKEMFRELTEKFEVLKTKHARRNSSALKFVEAFEDFADAHKAFQPWAWPAVKDKVKGMKDYASMLTEDYKEALRSAEAQRKRNELWDEIYNQPLRFLEGGRADGNKS